MPGCTAKFPETEASEFKESPLRPTVCTRHSPARAVVYPEHTAVGQELHVWRGASGKTYRYSAFIYGAQFGPGAANLIFAREVKRGQYDAICVAQTADLSEPYGDQATLRCIREGRPTHIHVHFAVGDESARIAECEDLIAALKPPCSPGRSSRRVGLVTRLE